MEPEDRQFLLEDSEFEEPVPGPLIRLGRRIDSMAKTVVSKFKDLSEKFASLKKKKMAILSLYTMSEQRKP